MTRLGRVLPRRAPANPPKALVLAVVLVLTLAGCAGMDVAAPGGPATLGSSSDINPHDASSLADGGNLRLAIAAFPDNFNPLQIDGNTAENGAMLKPTMPRAFTIGPDGSATVDHDYFTDVQLTGTNPQRVTYTINPKAVWSDGTPITWRDIAAQINATSGQNKDFAIASPNGSERVAGVTRGVDDRQAVITFAKPYSDWRGMFAGNGMLLPASATTTPAVFNKGQLSGPCPSAGPFIMSKIDRGAQRITLTRNPKWWGTRPRLDSISYQVLDDSARIPALRNNAIDATGLGTIDELALARRTKGIVIRSAPSVSWSHLTFNGAAGSILADPALRHAIAQGIDRQTIVTVIEHGLVAHPVPLNNRIYVAGQAGYQDNSADSNYNPAAAARALDAAGWKLLPGKQFRERGGQQLVIRDVFYDSPSGRQIGQIAQKTLGDLGVKLDLVPSSGADLFSRYVIPGNFDIATFAWSGDAFPLGSLTQIYAADGESNFGKIGTPQIDEQIDATLNELDPVRARASANELDRMLWAETFSLPLAQSPGNIAVRSTLANYGAAGLADLDYTAIGYLKQ